MLEWAYSVWEHAVLCLPWSGQLAGEDGGLSGQVPTAAAQASAVDAFPR
ncbi:hypothetical protein [Kitasatospora sp. GP82]|nr:hypothetical protein [Kitasatospora sp. GP82]MDH6124742.1 hypothetical protein [Kitasatospora sp. GP82]